MRKFIPVLASIACFAGTARADIAAADVDPARSTIDMTLVGAGPVHASDLTLRESTDSRAAAIRATSVRRFADGNEPVAIAIVYNGQEIFIGNDDIISEDDPSRYVGALPGIRATVDSIAAMPWPAGSQAALISYSTGATVPLKMGAIERLAGKALGTQRDYYNKIGDDLLVGIDAGLRQLESAPTALKVLVVIGDGNDTDNEAAKPALVELKRRAAREHIETVAVIYKDALSAPEQVITAMVPNARTVASFESMASSIDAVLSRIADRTYVQFSGENLAWDGHEHALTVGVGNDDLDPEYVQLPRHAHASRWHRGAWWMQLGAGFGAVLLLALGMRLTFRWRDAI